MRIQPGGALLFSAAVIGALLLGSGGARANYSLTITSAGTLTSLADPNDILGAGTQLSSGSYSLSVYYNDVGGSTVATSPGVYTAYNDSAATGTITVTVDGHAMTTPFFGMGAADLLEETNAVINSITGTDPSGNQALVIQSLSAASLLTGSPDFQRSLLYTLTGSDTGSDSYTFTGAGGMGAISLSGEATSFSVQVPEPGSLVLVGGALLGLGLIGQRRRSVL